MKEALKLALEALENISTALREDDVLGSDIELLLNAAATVRVALAQPDEAVKQGRRMSKQGLTEAFRELSVQPTCKNDELKKPWVSLTKEEIDSALSKYQNWYEFAAHLENILKEKNQ